MIKSLINLIFNSKTKQSESINELKKNPSFRTIEEINRNPDLNIAPKTIKVNEGEIETVTLPDFGNIQGLYVSEWKKNNGAIIESGDTVCVIQNDTIVMELECIYSGKLIVTTELNQIITPGSELFKIEGVKN